MFPKESSFVRAGLFPLPEDACALSPPERTTRTASLDLDDLHYRLEGLAERLDNDELRDLAAQVYRELR